MKGITNEGEEVSVIYIDGKASTKYAKKSEAEMDAARLRKKFPDKTIEIKNEVREGLRDPKDNPCWKGYEPVGTKKKNGKTVPNCVPKKTNEGVIVGHDANDPEVAILGGAGTMSLSRLKKKARGEAEQLASDLTRGRFKAAAYNIKQLENTLKTIVAAEDEMEKNYFGEDIGESTDQKGSITNRTKDQQSRNSISEGIESSKQHDKWMHTAFDVRSTIAWRQQMVESTDAAREFNAWLRNKVNSLSRPRKDSTCIIAMLAFMDNAIQILYGEAIYQGEDDQYYYLTTKRGTNAYSKTHQLVFPSKDAFDQFLTVLRLRFGESERQIIVNKNEVFETRQPHPLIKAANKNLVDLASGEVRRREAEKKASAKAEKDWQKTQARWKREDEREQRAKRKDTDTIWRHIEHAISNYFPDGDPTDYLNPYMERNNLTWDDITRAAKKNGYKDLWDYWNTLAQDIENDAYYDWLAAPRPEAPKNPLSKDAADIKHRDCG